MKAIRKTLAIIDPTESRQASLDRAVEICKRSGSELSLLICDQDPVQKGRLVASETGLENARTALEQKYSEQLDRLAVLAAAELDTDPAAIVTGIRWDHPLSDAILTAIDELNPDLVIKETHQHGPVSRALFSNTDWELMRDCAKPLWLAKLDVAMSPPRIVAAVGPLGAERTSDSLNHRILRSARQFANDLDGELHVFHAFDVPAIGTGGILGSSGAAVPLVQAAAPQPRPELIRDAESRHRKAIDELLRDCAIGAASVTLRSGLAGQAIIDFSQEIGASLVVMGAASRSAIDRLLLGSTAEHTLDRVPSDLLVVRQAA